MLRRVLPLVLCAACGGSGNDPIDAAVVTFDAAPVADAIALPDVAVTSPDAPLAPDAATLDAPLAPDAPIVADARPPDARPIDAAPPDAGPPVCVATTGKQFGDCGITVKNGLAGIVEVRGVINCSGIDDCDFFMFGFTGTVIIRGAPGAVIRRLDRTDYQIIDVTGGHVTVQDLTIDLGEDTACVPVSGSPPQVNFNCLDAIRITDAEDAVVERVTITYPKKVGINFDGVKHGRISDVRVIGSHLDGIVVDGPLESLVIEDSLVAGSAAQGISISNAHPTPGPVVVRRNLLVGNYAKNLFLACGDGNDPCPGSQLHIEQASQVRVEDTAIKQGEGPPGGHTGGVELGAMATMVTLEGNDVHDHSGAGVHQVTGASGIAAVTLDGNELHDNDSGDVVGFAGGVVTESDSCHTAGCAAVKRGMLWALPGGASWQSNDLTAPMVKVNAVTRSSQPAGNLAVGKGTAVVLFDGDTEIDRVVVP